MSVQGVRELSLTPWSVVGIGNSSFSSGIAVVSEALANSEDK